MNAHSGSGQARPDYGSMPLDELETRERAQRDAFRDAFGALQDRLSDQGERVQDAARRTRGGMRKVDDIVKRNHRVALAASVGVGVALGYHRRRVVAEPARSEDEYVLVRRQPERQRTFLRAALGKLAGVAATELAQLASHYISERQHERAAQREQAPGEPGLSPLERADAGPG